MSSLSPSQQSRLSRFNCERTVDIHCHVLPGVDDGPRNMAEALDVCRAMVADGFTDVIATPHQLGRWDGTNLSADVRNAASQLQSQLDAAAVPLRVAPGGEVRLDERIPKLLQNGKISTLGESGVYLLLELPPTLAVNPTALVPYLTTTGVKIVLAHAERYDSLVNDEKTAKAWQENGAAIQINASTFAGDGEKSAETAAWKWLEMGMVSLVATDAHSIGSRRPRMSQAIEKISQRFGDELAKRVCIENPARIMQGRELA